jgi:hypothetical protein
LCWGGSALTIRWIILNFFQQEASIKGEEETPKVASDSLENDSSDSEVISNFVHQKKATM